MWGGVIRGFAGVKFSGSPKRLGAKRVIIVSSIKNQMKPKRSLYEK